LSRAKRADIGENSFWLHQARCLRQIARVYYGWRALLRRC